MICLYSSAPSQAPGQGTDERVAVTLFLEDIAHFRGSFLRDVSYGGCIEGWGLAFFSSLRILAYSRVWLGNVAFGITRPLGIVKGTACPNGTPEESLFIAWSG